MGPIPLGAAVRAADGSYVGRVVHRHPRHFVARKGLLFRKDFAVGYDQVTEVSEDSVELLVRRPADASRRLRERRAALIAGQVS
jgi:hypothetical protein